MGLTTLVLKFYVDNFVLELHYGILMGGCSPRALLYSEPLMNIIKNIKPNINKPTETLIEHPAIQLLNEQVKRNAKDIDQIKIRTTLLEQTLFFEVLLNKYAYETRNLITIIDSVLHGKLHTSVLHTQRWLAELREIMANIPIGTTLLLEIKAESISDFMKISKITIYHKGQTLYIIIFVIKIPLV